MNTDRGIRRSVMSWVRGKFQSPPVGYGLVNAYTVYDEDQLRATIAKTLTPTRPCIFLVDSYIRPTETTLPLVVVEVPEVQKRPFELGNVEGRRTECLLHCFGRMRGERDDLSSFLANNLTRSMPIYDYTSGTGVFVENAVIESTVKIKPVTVSRSDLRVESSLDAWTVVEFAILTLS